MTDERDPKVSQRYRDLAGEEPSHELDQTILAAAHRAADKPHAPLVVPAGRHRWYFSLGAVAILVLAVAVTLQVERQQPDPELTVPPPPLQQKVEPAPPAAPAPAAKARSPSREERRQVYAPNPPPAEPAAQPPMEAPQAQSQQAQEKAAADRGAPSLRSSPAAASQFAIITPERELERIAELRRQGRDEEADKALAEFRKRYPDYRIPQATLEKVERKPAR